MRPSLLTTYYHKLTRIFLASDNLLFHAYSVKEYYTYVLQAHRAALAADAAAADGASSKKKHKRAAAKKAAEDAEAEAAAAGDSTSDSISHKLSDEERSALAGAAILAMLAIPPPAGDGEPDLFSSESEGHMRLASLLRFKKETPSRSRLAAELKALGVFDAAPGK
jgi:hypothetical protein